MTWKKQRYRNPPCPCLRRVGDYTHRQHPSTPTWFSCEHLPSQWRVVTLEQQRICEMSFKMYSVTHRWNPHLFHVECRGAPPFSFVIANRLWVLFLSLPTAASCLCSSRPRQVGKSGALPPDYCSCATVRQAALKDPSSPGFKLGGRRGMRNDVKATSTEIPYFLFCISK